MNRFASRCGVVLLVGAFIAVMGVSMLWAQYTFKPSIPKVWDDAELATWATPVAGLNVPPAVMSAKEYYALRVENLHTYPVYPPGHEPEGYWKMLHEITSSVGNQAVHAGALFGGTNGKFLSSTVFGHCVRTCIN